MANSNEFIDILSPSALSNLSKGISSTKELVKEILKAVAAQGKLSVSKFNSPSASAGNTKNNNSATVTANRLQDESARLTQRLTDLKKAEAIENAKLRVEISNLTKEQKKEAQQVLGVLDAYQKLNMESNELYMQSRNLAAQMFILEQAGENQSDAYKQLAADYQNVSNRAVLLDNGLKKIDSGLGRNQRYVGEYTRGWNSLSNAINQLTREAPAFALSLSTGFLAISNNLPILVDEIAKLNTANKELVAQGKPTVSVFKQLATALFSWQTALSIGVTLLTVYGQKIGEWVGNLFGANKELEKLEENQKNLNAASVEGRKSTVDTIIKLRENLAIAKDAALTDAERQISLKKLRSEYSFYFKDLTDAQILAGDTKKAEDALRIAIDKRAEADRLSSVIVENKQRLIQLRDEQKANDKLITQAKARVKDVQTLAAGDLARGQLLDRALNLEAEARTKIKNNTAEQNAILSQNAKYEELILQYRKDSIGLDEQSENTKDKKTQYAELADFYASAYELRKTQLESEATANKLVVEDEAKSYEERSAARERYYTTQLNLSKDAYAEERRLLEKGLNDEIKDLNRRVKDGEITEKNRNAVIYSLRRQFNYNILTAEEKNAEAVRNINRELSESLKGVWGEMQLKKETNLIDERELNNTRSYVGELKKIVEGNEDYHKVLAAEKAFQETNISLTQERLQAEERAIQAELDAFPVLERDSTAYLEIQDKLTKKIAERAEVDKKGSEEQAAALVKLQKATEEYIGGFTDLGKFGFDSLNPFFKLEENGKTVFANLVDGANTTAEKIAVIFNTISNVASQSVDFLQQNQQARFDAQYAALEKQYELDQEFNAKGEEAKAELQRQYDEKRREIRIQEAKAEKENAIFKAIINTAQGVTSALATANIPLSILIGTLGAAQIAAIAARQIPAYEFGTANHPGGLAIVGDGGRSELIHQPSSGWSVSPNSATLMNLERGSVVLPDANAYRRQIPTIDTNGGVSIDYDRLASAVGSKIPASTQINMSKRGIEAWAVGSNTRAKQYNDRISSRGRKI